MIVVRPPRRPRDRQAAARISKLEDAIARGIAQTGVEVVGIGSRDSAPSQTGWYRDRELSTVNNVDETAGRAALVFVLAGTDGSFGRGDGAQDLLPPVVEIAPRHR